ncbi:MAG: 30S ribosomal protein S20 [Dehalococcoidia bacterium]
MSNTRGNKAARAAERKRLRNRLVRRSIKTYMVKAKSALDADEESAHQKTMMAMSSVDKAVNKGIIHKNRGARLKSVLMNKLDKGQGATS